MFAFNEAQIIEFKTHKGACQKYVNVGPQIGTSPERGEHH
jgi:hypothetical protein